MRNCIRGEAVGKTVNKKLHLSILSKKNDNALNNKIPDEFIRNFVVSDFSFIGRLIQ